MILLIGAHKQQRLLSRGAGLASVVLLSTLSFALSGCVSSTLDSSQFRAVGSNTATNDQQAADAATSPTSLTAGVSTAQEGPVQTQSQTQTQTQAQSLTDRASEEGSVFDPQARAAAVAEMREKAGQRSGTKKQIGDTPEPATERLDAAGQRQLEAELKRSAAASENSITDAELAAKQRSIAELRRKAQRHYQDTLKGIEN